MGSKSLNQVLAEVLRAELSRRQLSNKKLATMSRVAEGTIRNYLAGDDPQHTSTGKERSAKLTEVERIAVALGLHPLALLTDPTEQRARVEAMALAAAEAAASYNVAVEPLPAQAPAASFGKLPQRAAYRRKYTLHRRCRARKSRQNAHPLVAWSPWIGLGACSDA